MKIKSQNFNPTNFRPLPDSNFNKWDAVTPEGKRIELKKYSIKEARDWQLYCEPIIKVSKHSETELIAKEYGDGDHHKGRDRYNDFLNKLFESMSKDQSLENVQFEIVSKSEGIEFKDGFVDKSNLEFRWTLKANFWRGYDRVMLEFRVKE